MFANCLGRKPCAGRLAALAMLVLPASLPAAQDSDHFKQIYQTEWAFRLKEFPLLASYAGVDEYNGELGHVTEQDQQRRYAVWEDVRQQLEEVSCARLTHQECIDYRLFTKQIDDFLADYQTRAYLIPFTSDEGFFLNWNRLPSETRFGKPQDYRDYLSRLSQIGVVMDEYIALMRTGLELGFTQPHVILAGRDQPIAAQLVDSPENSPFFAPFRDLQETMDPREREELRAGASRTIATVVIPAYRRLLAFFRDEYLPGSRTTIAAYDLPGGEAYYQAQVRRYATVDLSPQQIHDIGVSEVARIRSEMEAIIRETGFEGDFAAFLEFLRTDPQFYAKTPRELLSTAAYYAKKIDGRLPMLFGHLPRQPYGIAPVPDELAPFYTSGRYYPAPLNATRGGYYWVNTYDLKSRTLYTIPSLTLHEAAPGHHTQGALALEQEEQPAFRRNDYISAYGEGWGLYAEKLGVEMGIYETPYENFGRLTYEMWRACRLVIDTGIHTMGWSREQAQSYLSGNTALSLHEVSTEVDRYISWPAQALSYKLGEYTIWQLRREAEKALGERFDVRAFHDFILGLGSVTLAVLEDEVRNWITAQSRPGRQDAGR
jgi:uncharacterized protein (DUF885 family)